MNKQIKDKKKHNIHFYIVTLFLIFQPIIDMITYFMIRLGLDKLSFGVVTRFAFMLYLVLFVLLYKTERKSKKYILIYYGALIAFAVVSLTFNIMNKGTAIAFTEVKGLIKVLYFPVVLVGLLYILKGKYIKLSPELLLVTLSVYTFIIFISTITGTYNYSYGYLEFGSTGWFFAANEIGTIIGIITPYTLYYALNAKNTVKTVVLKIFSVALLIFAVSVIGTKVPLFAMFLYIAAFTLIYIILAIIEKRPKQLIKSGVLVLLVVITAVSGFAFNSPTYIAMSDVTSKILSVLGQSENISPDDDKTISNIILSHRDDYVEESLNDFKESKLISKIFGIGIVVKNSDGNLRETTTEQDMSDLFFYYGFVGITLILLPLVTVCVLLLVKLFKNFKTKGKNTLLLSAGFSLVIGLCIAYLSGHTLTAPGVSIYICTAVAILSQEIDSTEDAENCSLSKK